MRNLLIEAALIEFGCKGFDGASTRAIARRADAHQPQINYHFDSKEALWEAAVDHLFDLLNAALLPPALELHGPERLAASPDDVLGERFADRVRRFVRFAADHPELNRIIVHEATAETDRLRWMVDRHVRPLFEETQEAWTRLQTTGIAAPIDASSAHYMMVGAASLPFVNAPEVRLLAGIEPTDSAWVESHAEGLIAMLLPGRRSSS